MIFGWKKQTEKAPLRPKRSETLRQLHALSPETEGRIQFERVTLPPAIQDLSLEIPWGAWVLLHGDDDFAKALFCDLCFSYILPEQGSVFPGLKGSDVSFLGRSNTTYGRSLVEHLGCGVQGKSRELIEHAVNDVLSARFHRHLQPGSLQFLGGRPAHEMELDERDFLEIAEANVLLQRRRAAVIDTSSDFYQIAIEQGFRHSGAFLRSGKILFWILPDKQALPENARPWALPEYQGLRKISLSFPAGGRAGYVN